MSSENNAGKHIALGPSSVQEAYDILSATNALGIELPAPIGTVAYEASARSKNIDMRTDVVFDQYLGLYSSFESAMLALAGLALKGLESETALYLRPWIPKKIGASNIDVVTPEENARLCAAWIKGKTLDTIIKSYYADYTVIKRKIEHEPYEYMSILHNAETGLTH